MEKRFNVRYIGREYNCLFRTKNIGQGLGLLGEELSYDFECVFVVFLDFIFFLSVKSNILIDKEQKGFQRVH